MRDLAAQFVNLYRMVRLGKLKGKGAGIDIKIHIPTIVYYESEYYEFYLILLVLCGSVISLYTIEHSIASTLKLNFLFGCDKDWSLNSRYPSPMNNWYNFNLLGSTIEGTLGEVQNLPLYWEEYKAS